MHPLAERLDQTLQQLSPPVADRLGDRIAEVLNEATDSAERITQDWPPGAMDWAGAFADQPWMRPEQGELPKAKAW